jgi:hypothetical protein
VKIILFAKLFAISTGGIVALLLGFVGAAAEAEVVQATYSVSASDFQDSLGGAPVPPTSTSVSGTYTFTFDTTVSENEIMPDAVTGLDITDNSGAVIDFDEFTSGVNVGTGGGAANVTLGGNLGTVAAIFGGTEDFRVIFQISLVDFEVLLLHENLRFNTTVDAGYLAQTTSVTLVPEPTAWVAHGAGFALLAVLARRRKRCDSSA